MTAIGRDLLADVVVSRPLFRRAIVALWLIAVGIVPLGCSTTDVFYADQVPTWLQAPHIENARTLDLSQLANGNYSNDTIDRGDVIEVTINAGLDPKDNVTFPVRISEHGTASLPVVGDVAVQGLEPESAEAAIAAACIQRNVYRSPQVTVSMKRQRTNRVMVVGAVKNSGVHYLPRNNSDLFSALVAAGSLAEDAGTVVDVRNPAPVTGPVLDKIAGLPNAAGDIAQTGHSQSGRSTPVTQASFRVDLVSATKTGQSNYQLGDGAIVRVERRDPLPVHVIGLVNKPGKYEYPVSGDLSMLDAVALAGGQSNKFANKIYVIRHLPNQPKPEVIETTIREAKRNGVMNLKLAPGDTVSVEQTPSTVLLDAIMLIRFGVGASLGTFF